MPSPRCLVVTVVSRNRKYNASTSRSYVILIGPPSRNNTRRPSRRLRLVNEDRPNLLCRAPDAVPLALEPEVSSALQATELGWLPWARLDRLTDFPHRAAAKQNLLPGMIGEADRLHGGCGSACDLRAPATMCRNRYPA